MCEHTHMHVQAYTLILGTEVAKKSSFNKTHLKEEKK